jgi:predicted Rossmann fold nucleotide-binding protein DprA/Smf involved in DNA uptake
MNSRAEISDGVCCLALLMTPGVGVVSVNRMVLALGEAGIPLHAVVGGTTSMLCKGLPVGMEWAVDGLGRCEGATIDRAGFLYDRVLKMGGQWVSTGDGEYPELLKSTMEYNAPPLMSVFGDTELLNRKCISVVGAREPSKRGLLLGEELGSWCSEQGRLVVSGGANGIDLAAHRSALESGGCTALVLPEGVLNFEGPSWLKGYIESGNAVAVSQFLPDAMWSGSGAMGRNRTIAAIGGLACVVDPGEDGGSRRIAEFSLDYDKRTLVYAYDKVNSAYQGLIQGGAYPILNENIEWDALYLEDHWNSCLKKPRKQIDLF